jgi:agmatinase
MVQRFFHLRLNTVRDPANLRDVQRVEPRINRYHAYSETFCFRISPYLTSVPTLILYISRILSVTTPSDKINRRPPRYLKSYQDTMHIKPFSLLLLLPSVSLIQSHTPPSDSPPTPEILQELKAKWGTDYVFSGISTFAHLPHKKCLLDPSINYDIAIIGAPFDTAVSYRPGARFGPRAIRGASARQISMSAFNPAQGINPYLDWAQILDCGDIPISPFDNNLALRQMTEAFSGLLSRPAASNPDLPPRLVTLGGDHSIALAALRALKKVHGGPVSVLHFDAHLDTWPPSRYPSAWKSDQAAFTHGTMFHLASEEGLLLPSVHAGIRTRLSGTDYGDWEHDEEHGWMRIVTDEIDDIGVTGVIEKILGRLRGKRVYLSFDIDVIDPGLAPGTGTPEIGGWTTREVLRIIRGVVKEVEVVGMDMVEVAPAYDGPGEVTALAAAQVVYEVLSGMVKKGPLERVERVTEPGKAEEVATGKDEL